MVWGAGSALGLLTFLGYLLFTLGALLIWRHRDDVFLWVHDEISYFRRNFSRFIPVGPFYCPRQESRLRTASSSFFGSVQRFPFNRVNGALILFVIGFILFVLDFFF
jgi:hypothetical protein